MRIRSTQYPSGVDTLRRLSFADSKDAMQTCNFVKGATKFGIREVVDEPVDRGVEMGKDGHIQMGFVWESVVPVDHYNESIRNPAGGENRVNYKQSSRQTDGGFGRLLSNLVLFHPFCAFGHRDVDVKIREPRNDNRNPDQSYRKHDSVVVGCHPIPNTLQALSVERMVTNSRQIQKHQQKTNAVQRYTHQYACGFLENFLVILMMADENVSIETHQCNCTERVHAGHRATVRYELTKSWVQAEEIFAL